MFQLRSVINSTIALRAFEGKYVGICVQVRSGTYCCSRDKCCRPVRRRVRTSFSSAARLVQLHTTLFVLQLKHWSAAKRSKSVNAGIRYPVMCVITIIYLLLKLIIKPMLYNSKNVYWSQDRCILHFTNVSLNVNSKISCLELIFLSNSLKQDTFKGI